MPINSLATCLQPAKHIPPWRSVLTAVALRHPLISFTVGMLVMGLGMVAAVTVTTASLILPLALLFGW